MRQVPSATRNQQKGSGNRAVKDAFAGAARRTRLREGFLIQRDQTANGGQRRLGYAFYASQGKGLLRKNFMSSNLGSVFGFFAFDQVLHGWGSGGVAR